MYKSLNDASIQSSIFKKGQTKIWYVKDSWAIRLIMFEKKLNKALVPTTHILLGEIAGTDLEEIFQMLQGENWSPEGEARELIKNKELNHTSMLVGDVIQIGEVFYLVDEVGFKELN